MQNCDCGMNQYSMKNANVTSRNNNTNIYDNYSNSFYSNNVFPKNYLYGHAYTPNQMMNNTFSPEVGLKNGTLFPELVSPYCPGQSMDFINYLKSNRGMGGM